MSEYKTDVPYGTLDLLILKTLDTMGPMHGYRIARRIEQVAENLLRLNQGSIYPALIRLEEQGWIRTQWGISETKRKVKFYSLTRAGSKQLNVAVANWERATALVASSWRRVVKLRFATRLLALFGSGVSMGSWRVKSSPSEMAELMLSPQGRAKRLAEAHRGFGGINR
jgi:transcriptional regulator